MISTIQNFLEQFFTKLHFLLPELCIASGSLLLLIVGLFRLKNHLLIWLYVLILLGALFASFFLNGQALFLPFRRLVILSALGSVVFFIHSPFFRSKNTAESLFLLSSSALGLNMMMLAEDLLSLFVALELAAIASYILVILAWKKQSAEGAIKYLLFGAFASAMMLYGISWLYGLSGSIDLKLLSWKFSLGLMQYAAIFMMLSGLLMKISAVPYHIWTPDAYQIAPTPVVVFLATASKVAGIVAILKLVRAYEPIFPDVTQILAVIATASILLGNLVAFWQKNFKRMLAYSSVANAGYLLIGSINHSFQDILFFFLLVYIVANFLIFSILEYYEQKYAYINVEDFSGIGKMQAIISLTLLVGLVALAGLPPTAGFTAKLLIFSALWEQFQANKQSFLLVWLLVGLFNTVVGLFYYLKAPYFAFFKEAKKPLHEPLPTSILLGAVLLSVLLIGLFVKHF